MTYFADLSPYTYGGGRADITTLNVGWLSRAHPFPTAPPDPHLIEALHRCCFRAQRFAMGLHPCEWCSERGAYACVADQRTRIGTGQIHIEHEGVCYAAPTLVVHYVQAHSYLPPAVFIAGVLTTASRIVLLSATERAALSGLSIPERRRVACAAVEGMVERSAHAWARPALAAARAGQRDWDAAIPKQFEDGVLLDVLGKLATLMSADVAPDPDSERFRVLDFLDVVERALDT